MPVLYFDFVNTYKYDEEKVVLDKYTLVEQSGIHVVYNWLQYFSRESLKSEFKESGFNRVEWYADVAGTAFSAESGEMAVVAKLNNDLGRKK